MDSGTAVTVEDGLAAVFRDVFKRGIALRPEMTAADVPGWDSIAMLSLVVAVEDRFGITLRAREIDQLDSVGAMVALIESKIAARGG